VREGGNSGTNEVPENGSPAGSRRMPWVALGGTERALPQQQFGTVPPGTAARRPCPPGRAATVRLRRVSSAGSAAGYGVFQFLFEVLPDSMSGRPATYLIAGVRAARVGGAVPRAR
jgi:hypothetical protein